MKIYKKKEHSPIFRPFCVEKKTQLGLGVLLYFDLAAPDAPLSDQELWKTLPEVLEHCNSKSLTLDEGMPKPRGEFLVLGKCFPLAGETARSVEVNVRVGGMAKTLQITGPRYWTSERDVLAHMSTPAPFSEMEICWENAFGGAGFELNPVGKGVADVLEPNGQTRRPLPNVEYASELIGAPSDRPKPAGFGPLDLRWPQRSAKTGTYDENWKNNRWPYYPEDMDYEYFNLAPADQLLPRFFKGDEEVLIEHMHTQYTRIETRLPALRVRCLVCRAAGASKRGRHDDVVVDAPLHPETLWLFPNLLRGVLIFRGVTEIQSEDLDDVRWIYLATESVKEAPKTLEYHLEAQKKMSSLTLDMDPNLMQSIAAKVDKAMSKVRAIPRQIEYAKKQAMGQAPIMPNRPAEVVAKAKSVIEDRIADMQRLQAMALDLNKKHGPVFSSKAFDFGPAIAKFKAASQGLDKGLAQMENGMAKLEDMQKNMSKNMKEHCNPEHLAKAGIDPDKLLPDPFSLNPWHDHGFAFVVDARYRLDAERPLLQDLEKLGFDRITLNRAWLGLHQKTRQERFADWGLPIPDAQAPDQPAPPVEETFELGPGLVIPYFEGPELKRLTIRPVLDSNDAGSPASNLARYWDHANDVEAPGSVATPLFLPATLGAPIVRAADELEAWFIEQEVGDLAAVLVLKTADAQPSDEAAAALAAAPSLVVLLPADPTAAELMWAPFPKKYPTALALPLPKGANALQAVAAGYDLRSAIMELLHIVHTAADGRVAAPPGPPDASFMKGFVPPVGDIKALVQKTIKDINEFVAVKTAPLKDLGARIIAEVTPKLIEAGIDPKAVFPDKPQPVTFSDLQKNLAQTMDQTRTHFTSIGKLTPELSKQLDEQQALFKKIITEGEARYVDGMARIEAAKETCAKLQAGELPPEVASRLEAAGVSPDSLKKLDRAAVIDKHSRGESLAGANMNGVDLSELDLRGVDLTQAMCMGTNFTGAILDAARMSQIMAGGANFTKASLRGANLRMGLCNDAVFDEADCSEADLTQTLCAAASMRKTRFCGARVYGTVLEDADLTQADFRETTAELSIFAGAKAVATSFKSAILLRCVFSKTLLDDADFSNAVLAATMFQGATGKNLNFKSANLNKARMGLGTSFPAANFTGSTMFQASFMDSNLSQAVFTDCLMQNAILQGCDLRGADLRHVEAKEIRLSKSDLSQARLMGANLMRGSLRMATLYDTDLRGANLFGVDFYKAKLNHDTLLDKANLTRAVFLQTFMDQPGDHDA